MEFYSTNNRNERVSLKEAVLLGLPKDNGLFMPVDIHKLASDYINSAHNHDFADLALEMTRTLLGDDLSESDLHEIVSDAFDIEMPLVQLEPNLYVLELFHGPTHAFKDFGARFMSRLMSRLLSQSERPINVLVATSGDTGSAVAKGFYGVDGIKVTLLYPQGKVSELQEKQLTTNGGNIQAIEVQGTFDDCQRMVKRAFLDEEIKNFQKLTSANSINVARLIPQSFYYFYAWSRLSEQASDIVFSVPSGNFGNLCGGLLAMKMGMPVNQFVAATNANAIVPRYLKTGDFNPKPSVQTLSNAMDVGNPSNFPRLLDLLDHDHEKIRNTLTGYHYDDEMTLETISEVYDVYDYFICPHSAIGLRALKDHMAVNPGITGVTLATAHPAKFYDTVDHATGSDVDIPQNLQEAMNGEKDTILIKNDFEEFKNYLMSMDNGS